MPSISGLQGGILEVAQLLCKIHKKKELLEFLNSDQKMTESVGKQTYQLVPESLALLGEMRSCPCQLGEGLCFPVVLKATEKEEGSDEAADI